MADEKEGKPFDLFIAFVSHRTISIPTMHSLELLRLAGTEGKLPFTYTQGIFTGDALLSRTRSQAMTKFLEGTDIPYMIFIDDDQEFQPIHVIKIYNHLKTGKYGMIGGIYPVRGASQLSSYGWEGKLAMDGKVRDIEYLATGFMGIARWALEKVVDKLNLPIVNQADWARCYPFMEVGRRYSDKDAKPFLTSFINKKHVKEKVTEEDLKTLLRQFGITTRPHGDSIYISEDWDLCDKFRDAGIRCYVDTSVQIGHMKETMHQCQDVEDIQLKAYNDKEMFGAVHKQEELMRSVDTDIAEFLKVDVKEAQKRINETKGNNAKLWNEHEGSVEDFYTNNEESLFDSALLNLDPEYFSVRLGGLINFRGAKTLDVGCGNGTATFMLAEQGCDVTGYDINKVSIDFCEYRKKKYDLKGNFTTKLPDEEFDLVIAIDVLEHIENLKDFLYNIGKKMRKGARLYHSDWFGKYDPTGQKVMWPMHFDTHEERLDAWLEEAGFIKFDSVWAVKT